MDTYYRELITKEREAFQRILASKLAVQASQIERKMEKKSKAAQGKMEKANHYEQRLSHSTAHAKRLQTKVELQTKQSGQLQKQNQKLESENQLLRQKLEEFQHRREEEEYATRL